jgi:hypothetical protein
LNDKLSFSIFTVAKRRWGGVRSVAQGAVNRQIPQKEFSSRCAEFQKEAAAQNATMPPVVDGLWKTEGFATTFGKYRLDENTLNDPAIPRESLGITHVGYGAACTEFAHFDPGKLKHIFSTLCQPNYAPQAIEGVGSILRIYEPGFFKKMCGWAGLIPRDAPPGPDRTGFFASFLSNFTGEEARLITHGYGRLVAFSNLGLGKAIEEVKQLPGNRMQPCAQGAAFAFAMMNSPDMGQILEASEIESPGPIRSGFQNGLVYGLVYCDWFAPGFLSHWKPQGTLEGQLVQLAQDEAARNQKRGYLLPFQLENPR